jgi:hypothetical protein
MKFRILIVLILFCNVLYGQSFNLNELIRLSKSDLNYFDTYVTNKGFMFLEKRTESNYIANVYVQNSASGYKTNYISKLDYFSHNEVMIAYRTINSKIYLNIKNDLVKYGFKYIENGEDDDGNIYFTYRKGKLEVSLLSDKTTNAKLNSNKIDYEIGVSFFK